MLFVTTFAALALAVCSAQAAAPQWVQMTPTTSPPARFGDSMAYDAATNQLVLLDSLNGGTWIWDGADWSQATPAASPPPTTYAQMAYDPITQQLILFGGENGTGLTDTRELDRTPRVICRLHVRCTVHAPPGTAGTVDVTVAVGGLTSRPSQRDRHAQTLTKTLPEVGLGTSRGSTSAPLEV